MVGLRRGVAVYLRGVTGIVPAVAERNAEGRAEQPAWNSTAGSTWAKHMETLVIPMGICVFTAVMLMVVSIGSPTKFET